MKSKITKIVEQFKPKKVQDYKIRCLLCNNLINKKNLTKHRNKVHHGKSLDELWYDYKTANFLIPKKLDYYEYIQSPEWKQKADKARKRAGYRCQVCNRSIKEIVLDVHHRTYERLGNERNEDLTVLCRDCHSLFETKSNHRPTNKNT